jgi:acetyl-CoA C-acetyltransferase
MAMVAENSYRAGTVSRYAHVKEGFSSGNILGSEVVASPLRARTVAMQRSYGAAALILTSERVAKQVPFPPIVPLHLTGFGMSTFADDLDDWLAMSAVKQAALKAYEMAGIKHPSDEFAAVEINAPFAPFELAAYSTLGLCREGEEAELLKAGRNGGMQINPSGGTLCTNAPNSGGVFRTVQAAMALESRDTNGRSRAVVHDSDLSLGVAGSSHAVLILERG